MGIVGALPADATTGAVCAKKGVAVVTARMTNVRRSRCLFMPFPFIDFQELPKTQLAPVEHKLLPDAAALPSPATIASIKAATRTAYRGPGRMGMGCVWPGGNFPRSFCTAQGGSWPISEMAVARVAAAGCWGVLAATVASGPQGATYAPDRRAGQFPQDRGTEGPQAQVAGPTGSARGPSGGPGWSLPARWRRGVVSPRAGFGSIPGKRIGMAAGSSADHEGTTPKRR